MCLPSWVNCLCSFLKPNRPYVHWAPFPHIFWRILFQFSPFSPASSNFPSTLDLFHQNTEHATRHLILKNKKTKNKKKTLDSLPTFDYYLISLVGFVGLLQKKPVHIHPPPFSNLMISWIHFKQALSLTISLQQLISKSPMSFMLPNPLANINLHLAQPEFDRVSHSLLKYLFPWLSEYPSPSVVCLSYCIPPSAQPLNVGEPSCLLFMPS